MSCKHENFSAQVDVHRLVSDVNPDELVAYTSEIKINCADCGHPFQFIGVPHGFSFVEPTTNFDGTKLNAPLQPSNDPVHHANSIINQNKNT